MICFGSNACSIAQRQAFSRARNSIDAGNYRLALAQLAVAELHGDLSKKKEIDLAYLRARSYEGLDNRSDAIRVLRSIVHRFPDSPYSDLAREKIKFFEGVNIPSEESLEAEPSGIGSMTSQSVQLLSKRAAIHRANPDFVNYLNIVRRKIDLFWRYPCDKTAGNNDCNYREANLNVGFVVGRNGDVLSISINQKSGIPAYDFNAIEAVILAAPFPPIPPDINASSDSISLLIKFEYVDNRPKLNDR